MIWWPGINRYLILSCLKCHPSLRPTPERVSLALPPIGGWGEETDDISDE